MMENHEFSDHCPGCRPEILDLVTCRPLSNDSPIMIAVNHMWNNNTSYQERKAYVEVTLHNSRLLSDLILANSVFTKIKKVMENCQL